MQIDWTLNVGHIIYGLGLLGGVAGIIYSVRADVSALKNDLGKIEVELKAMTGVLVQIAKQEVRQDSFEHRLDRLEQEIERYRQS